MGSIPLSPQHGVNPALLVCPLCGADSGVALCGRLKGDAEAPRRMLDQGPCQKCVEEMKTAILLAKVKVTTSSPIPCGEVVGVTEDWVRARITPDELRDQILKERCAMIPESDWEQCGIDDAIAKFKEVKK